MKLIDKDVLIAEIEKRINFNGALNAHSRLDECNAILSFIDTLEAKEVDLEKAIDDYIYTHDGRKRLALELDWKCCNLTLKGGDEIIKFAKNFFQLGLNASNPITAADRGMAEEIIINLKRVENDYLIDLTREMEWVRNKSQKG